LIILQLKPDGLHFFAAHRTKYPHLNRFVNFFGSDSRFSIKFPQTITTKVAQSSSSSSSSSSSLASINARLQSLSRQHDIIFTQWSQQVKQQIKKLIFNDISQGEKLVLKSCRELGLKLFYLRQTPSDYYNWNLEKRRSYLKAHSIHHLCKLLIIENKECKLGLSDPFYSQFYCVVIQYTTLYVLYKYYTGILC